MKCLNGKDERGFWEDGIGNFELYEDGMQGRIAGTQRGKVGEGEGSWSCKMQ